jgi:hypothetical protein
MPIPSGPTASLRTRRRPFPLDRLTPDDQTADRLRLVARIWVMAAVVTFIALSLRPELLHHPDLPYWSGHAWDGLLYLMAIGALVSWRWEGAGATLLMSGASAIGILAALEEGPLPAFGMALLFLIPGLLFWLLWQREGPAWHGAALAAGLGITVAVVGYYAVHAYMASYGPLQPESTAVVEPSVIVDWIWSGAVTDTSAVVTAAMTGNVPDARLIVSTRDDLSAPLMVEPDATATISSADLRRFSITGLSPDTDYWYAITADGATDEARRGQFRTFPSGAASFTFAFGACANTGSNAVVFDAIRSTDPLFFLSTGDLFYEDIAVNDPNLYREAFDRTLASRRKARCTGPHRSSTCGMTMITARTIPTAPHRAERPRRRITGLSCPITRFREARAAVRSTRRSPLAA